MRQIITILVAVPLSCLFYTRDAEPDERNAIVIAFYYQKDQPDHLRALDVLKSLAKKREGLIISPLDVSAPLNAASLKQVRNYYRLNDTSLPLTYTCNNVLVGFKDAATLEEGARRLLRVDIFTAKWCDPCQNMSALTPSITASFPALETRVIDVDDPAHSDYVERVFNGENLSIPSLFCANNLCTSIDMSSVEAACDWVRNALAPCSAKVPKP